MESYKIYALELQQSKWIIHLSNKENMNDILFESILLYPYMQKYIPIKNFSNTCVKDSLEIDFFVKKYMRSFGIDNVRGGSYVDEVIPNDIRDLLIHELNSTFLKYKEKQNETDILVEKYNTILTWSEDKINEEIIELERNVLSIDQLKNHIDNLSYLNKDTEFEIKINDSILETGNWLEHIACQENRNLSSGDIEKYNNFIIVIYGLYFIFSNYVVNRMTKELHMYVQHPRIVFDKIFFQNKRLSDEEIEICKIVVSDIKYMYNCIINTKDELTFDYTNLPYYNNNINNTCIAFLKETFKNKSEFQST